MKPALSVALACDWTSLLVPTLTVCRAVRGAQTWTRRGCFLPRAGLILSPPENLGARLVVGVGAPDGVRDARRD